jgi:VIT1/CCC1 family predicted Fe2+/Mn2+ transporter
MGLGGYLAAKTDLEHYLAERMRERRETERIPEEEAEEVAQIFRHYGLTDEQIAPLVAAIRSDPDRWVDFMMRFELGLEPPDPVRARKSALTIGLAYVFGGLVPLWPYILLDHLMTALGVSILVTPLALLLFGYIKGRLTGIRPWRSAWQTLGIGGLAATAAFLLARAIG